MKYSIFLVLCSLTAVTSFIGARKDLFTRIKFRPKRTPICEIQKYGSLPCRIMSSMSLRHKESMPCKIKVIGVGGGGGNAVRRMHDSDLQWPEFWAVNTDTQALQLFNGTDVNMLPIGDEITNGLGAGSNAISGRLAAEASRDDIEKAVGNADLVFITAGMGGGTGSGAAPLVAEIARSAGALTIGIVTKPFSFEGRPRNEQAEEATKNLNNAVDALITVSNDCLLRIIPSDTPIDKAFAVVDEVLRQAVTGVSEIIMKPGLINVDFADVKAIMQQSG